MRTKHRSRCSNAKDRVKEASKRLKAILKTSRKLGISNDDISKLKSVSELKTARIASKEPLGWAVLSLITLSVVIGVFVILFICEEQGVSFMCVNNTATKDVQVQTVSLERLSLDSAADLTKDNDSEDGGHIWTSSNLRLHRER